MANFPYMQFQHYNPMDNAINTAMDVYGGLTQTEGQRQQNEILRREAENPMYAAGGDAAQLAAFVDSVYGPGASQNLGALGGQQAPGGGMPMGMQQGDATGMPMGMGMGADPGSSMGAGAAPGMQQGGGAGMPFDIAGRMEWAGLSPLGKEVAMAEAMLGPQVQLAEEQARISTQQQVGVAEQKIVQERKIDAIQDAAKVASQANEALVVLDKFHNAYEKMPTVFGLEKPLTMLESISPEVQTAKLYQQELVNLISPIMFKGDTMSDARLASVAEGKIDYNLSGPAERQAYESTKNAMGRMKEQSSIFNELNRINPDISEPLMMEIWNEYNTAYPITEKENVGKWQEFIGEYILRQFNDEQLLNMLMGAEGNQ